MICNAFFLLKKTCGLDQITFEIFTLTADGVNVDRGFCSKEERVHGSTCLSQLSLAPKAAFYNVLH